MSLRGVCVNLARSLNDGAARHEAVSAAAQFSALAALLARDERSSADQRDASRDSVNLDTKGRDALAVDDINATNAKSLVLTNAHEDRLVHKSQARAAVR